MRRSLAVGLVGIVAAASLAACGSSGPDARPIADQVAAALTQGNIAKAAFAQPAAAVAGYAAIVSAMDGLTHTVSVTNVSTNGDKATATLDWSWPVGSKPWTYTTSLSLTRSGSTWTPVWSPNLVAPLASATQLQLVRTPATRGRILDGSGNVLVGPRPVVTFGIDKTLVSAAKAPASAAALAQVVGIEVKPFVASVKASGPRAFVEAITLRAQDVSSAMESRVNAITGAAQSSGTLPLAPTKGFAGGILGTVGQATAQIVQSSKGQVVAGDIVGTSGLEQRYDSTLRGTPGSTVEAVGSSGSKTLFTSAPIAGKDLRVNLNLHLQTLADSILANVGPASALVAIQPSTGKVLAISDGPGSNGYLDATIGQFPPGSTFKTITSLALFRSGLNPNSTVPCTPAITIDGKTFTNDSFYPPSGLGQIPLKLAYANSCNTAYLSQHGRLKPGGLANAAAALGFGVDAETGYGSFFGQVPPATSVTGAAADMIGQGTILASPLAMATVLSSVVAGHAVMPLLIQGLSVPARHPADPLTAKEAAELRLMLRGVVTTPTGTGAALADLPGPPVLAKTGTAEFVDGSKVMTHAWMMAAQGDLAVAVFVDTGQTGAGVAGPLLEQFLRGARH